MKNHYYIFIFLLFLSLPANALDLADSQTLLATCTVEDNGYIGFKPAETTVEKTFATGRYERSIVSCMSYIQGVSNATTYSGDKSFCLNSVPLEDLKSVVVINLKQKYKMEENSVPLILGALRNNWPCQ